MIVMPRTALMISIRFAVLYFSSILQVMRAFFLNLPAEKKTAVLDFPVCKFVCMLSSAQVHMFAA